MKLVIVLLFFMSFSPSASAVSLKEFKQLKKAQAFDFKDRKFSKVLLRGQYYRLRYLSSKANAKEYFTKNLLLMEYISLLRLCRYQLVDGLFNEVSQLVTDLRLNQKILSDFKSKKEAVTELNTLSPTKTDKQRIKSDSNIKTHLKWKVANRKIKNLTLKKLEKLHFEIENKCEKL